MIAIASKQNTQAPTITKNLNFSLTGNFKVAGLANIVTAAFLTSSEGTAELQCVNAGGNNNPPLKKVDFGPLQGQTKEIQPCNGQIITSYSVTIGPTTTSNKRRGNMP